MQISVVSEIIFPGDGLKCFKLTWCGGSILELIEASFVGKTKNNIVAVLVVFCPGAYQGYIPNSSRSFTWRENICSIARCASLPIEGNAEIDPLATATTPACAFAVNGTHLHRTSNISLEGTACSSGYYIAGFIAPASIGIGFDSLKSVCAGRGSS